MNIEALLEAATANEVATCEDCGWERHVVPTTGRCVDCHIEAEAEHNAIFTTTN
jgi:RNA polymerase-binding transcription factor DksA